MLIHQIEDELTFRRSLTSGLEEDSDVPHIISHSDHAQQETALPPALGVSMDSFMAYLLFWQDTIDHCKSPEVVATLLDHFQVLFLEQLLWVLQNPFHVRLLMTK